MNRQPRYIYLSNIPKAYHACNLRSFYSQYVESSAFVCFHFRHRPQVIIDQSGLSVQSSSLLSAIKSRLHRDRSRHCALLSILPDFFERFIQQYNHTHWLSEDDELPLAEQCVLIPIVFTQESDRGALLQLIEFKPPAEMPQGNVGTPTSYFFTQIQLCRLGPTVITKLQLNFSGNAGQRKYGAVPYSYESEDPTATNCTDVKPMVSGDIRSRTGVSILDSEGYTEYIESQLSPIKRSLNETARYDNLKTTGEVDEDLTEPEEDEPCEEWERFEALHDDPYKVTRSDKANLKYEDKVELVWEKGSSGLVFHTDERTWRKLDPLRKEEPFDEPASLDWDVDMEPYEQPSELPIGPTPTGHWGSARDTCDLIDIQRSREQIDLPEHGLDARKTFHQQTCAKGYGQCLLRRMGWKPGSRLGPLDTGHSVRRGLLCPIEVDEHSLGPRTRTGLGYYGPPHVNYSILPGQMTNSVYIRTVFDRPEDVAQRSGLGLEKSLIRRDEPQLALKYRRQSEGSTQIDLSASTSRFIPRNRTVILNKHSALSKEGITFVFGGFLKPGSD
ncbi:G patch domain-containing protein 3 [Fasciola gigantica]|uniref:G patch domain-containing protein 3 n=1 Tax=Fasciola gigantica TaxID=46835 RepID=A0A504YNZ3_FASGI|nr:G patch domain-containing protein 3 [Fasciola gigantica]